MKFKVMIFISILLVSCSNNTNDTENRNSRKLRYKIIETDSNNQMLSESDHVILFNRNTNFLGNSDIETFKIIKNTVTNSVEILYNVTISGITKNIEVEDLNSYNPMFAIDKPYQMFDNTKYLDFINNSIGFFDVDNDGMEEFFFVFKIVKAGVAIMDIVDNKLVVSHSIYLFDSFFKIDELVYIVQWDGAELRPFLDLNRHKYEVSIIRDNVLQKCDEMPVELYNHYYSIISKIEGKKFEDLFLYIYNNRPSELSYSFVDMNFKSNSTIDEMYNSKEHIHELISQYNAAGEKSVGDYYNDAILGKNIYKTKYLYYYLIDKANGINY